MTYKSPLGSMAYMQEHCAALPVSVQPNMNNLIYVCWHIMMQTLHCAPNTINIIIYIFSIAMYSVTITERLH